MVIKRIFFFIFFLHLTHIGCAQKEGAIWYFGNGAGLNFNGGQPVPLNDGRVRTLEGVASISDRNGNLLFYSDGTVVLDRNHNIMPNGNDLKGNETSTQSVIIIPKPKNPGIYYLFTVDKPDYSAPPNDPIEGVHYSVIDMSLNSGFGDIVETQKNIHLVTYDPNDPKEKEFKSSEKIAAIVAGDCVSYWVVTQFTNKFYSFKVSENGVETSPVISSVPTYIPPTIRDPQANKTGIGYMKISPNGRKLAIAHASTLLGLGPRGPEKNNGKVFLYDFDNQTGQVSNEKLILDNSYPYGVEFSPKSTKLYITSNYYVNGEVLEKSELYQFDLESSNTYNSKTLLHKSSYVAGALQLAINGKIYRAGYPFLSEGNDALSVINKPEEDGNSAGYVHNSVGLGLGQVGLGLPQFIQSLLKNDFTFENLCFGDTTRFYIEDEENYSEVEWDFGDGNLSKGVEVTHTYSEPGSYIVTVYRYIDGILQEPVCKEIEISENPKVLDEYTLFQCDIYDQDPDDGIGEFNLQLAKEPISSDNSRNQIYFYEDRALAENDPENLQALPNSYKNTSPNQIVFAKVNSFGSKCYSIAKIILKTKKGVSLSPDPVSGCNLGNGKALFDLGKISEKIISENNLPADVSLTFHKSLEYASMGQRSLPLNYETRPTTLFINAESNNICYGAGQIELRIGELPDFPDLLEKEVCSQDFPLQLGGELNIDQTEYDIEWNNGTLTPILNVSNGGVFFLRLTNKKTGCERIVHYIVKEKLSPEITDVIINSEIESSSITVVAQENGETMYALDNINSEYQTDPFFENISYGPHTVYVKNQNECEIKMREIFVFGFPEFFTPNNDGYNDLWKPYDVESEDFSVVSILIYDRYGKLIKQLMPESKGWDGIFNGHPMPSDDYWFHVTLSNNRLFKGHFTLKRE